jgi:hypothetical protein
MNSPKLKIFGRRRTVIKVRMTHFKNYIDNLEGIVDMHDLNVRLHLLENVLEEYNTLQYQLEFNDDNERQKYALDRKTVTETYCELTKKIDTMILEDRHARIVSLRESQMSGPINEMVIVQRLRSNCLLLIFQNMDIR